MTSSAVQWLRLVRVGALFSPAADVVAGLCLAGLPWSLDAVRCCVASVALYAAGMVLNDHADRTLDAEQRPERPIPSGAITPAAALGAAIALFALALLVSPWWPIHAGLAALIVAYDYGSKRFVLGGVAAMATLRATNLASGAIALTTAVPAPGPLRMAAFAYFAYIASVTLLGILEDHPPRDPKPARALQTVAPIAAVLALLTTAEPWLATSLGAVLALAFLLRLRDPRRSWDRAAIRGAMTWLLLGTMGFTALLCLGSGRVFEAVAIGLAAVAARRIARRIALT